MCQAFGTSGHRTKIPSPIRVGPMYHQTYCQPIKCVFPRVSLSSVTHSNESPKSEGLSSQWRISLLGARSFWRATFFVALHRLFRLSVIELTFLVGSCDRASLETMMSTLFHWVTVSCETLMHQIPKRNKTEIHSSGHYGCFRACNLPVSLPTRGSRSFYTEREDLSILWPRRCRHGTYRGAGRCLGVRPYRSKVVTHFALRGEPKGVSGCSQLSLYGQ